MTQIPNLASVVEQIVLPQEQLKLQEILEKFQQVVPTNFVQLVSKERNYMCDTQGWKEPVCERYIFVNQGQPIQLDIPLTLVEKLELKKGESIPYTIYLSPSALNRTPTQLGITIEHENEIFLQQPLTIENLEKELDKWLVQIKDLSDKNSHLETKLNHYKLNLLSSLVRNAHKSQQTTNWKIKVVRLGAELFVKGEEIRDRDAQITNLNTQVVQLTTQRDNFQTQLNTSNQTNADLTGQVNNLNTEKTNLTNQITTLTAQINNLTIERDNCPNITQEQYNTLLQERNSFSLRPTQGELDNAIREKNQIQSELNGLRNINASATLQRDNLRNELNALNTSYQNLNILKIQAESNLEKEKNWWDKWNNDNKGLFRPEDIYDKYGSLKPGERVSFYFNDQYFLFTWTGKSPSPAAVKNNSEIKNLIKKIHFNYLN